MNTLAYSTYSAPVVKGHRVVVEMEADTGYRSWSGDMWESSVDNYVRSFPSDYMLSDIDHAGTCPCGSDGWPQEG